MDGLLGCLTRLDATAEDFVQDALRRTATWQVDRQPLPQAADAQPVPSEPVPPAPKRRGDSLWVRKLAALGGSRWFAAIACSIAVLLLAAIGWRWLARGPRGGDNVNQPEIATQPAPQPTTPEINDSAPQVDRAFATLIQSSDTAWDTPPAGGDRLSAGVLRLVQGSAELHFDKGTVVFLTGPAALELRGPDEVSLQRGSLNARVPKPAVGFTVVTPLSRVVDLGTEFDVVVQESGAVATLVHEGRVSLQPQRGQEQRAKPIELAVGALDHATTSVPDIAAPVLPVMTVAGGDEGRYLGMVSLDGKTAEFHSPQAFDAFQARVLQQMRKAPRQFRRQWPVMVEKSTVGAAASGKTSPDRQEPPAVKDPGRHAGPDVSGGSNGSAAPALHRAPELSTSMRTERRSRSAIAKIPALPSRSPRRSTGRRKRRRCTPPPRPNWPGRTPMPIACTANTTTPGQKPGRPRRSNKNFV